MPDELEYLRAENASLRAEGDRLATESAQQREAIATLQHYVRRLLRGRFGRATEKLLGRPREIKVLCRDSEGSQRVEGG